MGWILAGWGGGFIGGPRFGIVAGVRISRLVLGSGLGKGGTEMVKCLFLAVVFCGLFAAFLWVFLGKGRW